MVSELKNDEIFLPLEDGREMVIGLNRMDFHRFNSQGGMPMKRNLIDEVKELGELEKSATPTPWKAIEGREAEFLIISNPKHPIFTEKGDCDTPDANFISTMRNAAPAMLAVLRIFRKFDSRRLGDAAKFIDERDPKAQMVDIIDCVNRLQKAAALMEAADAR
jgi:hypothetical protein